MPLTRFRVRSEFGLADPELYRAADKDDPEALLEGVAMAGLVGVLRQLGDLAEFAAEIFHDLHEEVMATATRGHGLVVRVQQLEAEFPPIEKALLSQTSQSSLYYNTGVDWHPNLHSEQNLIARGDLPRFVMDSYEESRGPPRLFLLDKFDVGGAGACLKRYTDPSFFKVEASASGISNVEIPREKKSRRVKKKGLRGRNGETTPEVMPASHSKLQQLFLEERIENGYSDPSRLVKLKKRHLNGSPIDSRSGKSYMEKFVETPKERELACETSIVPVSFTPEYATESGIRILEISTVSQGEKSPRSETAFSSPSVHEDVSKPLTNGYNDEVDNVEIVKVPDTSRNDETSERSPSIHELQVEKQLTIYGEGKTKAIVNGYESDDVTSEVDNYMDALASIESEIETDNEYRPNRTMRFLKAEIHGTDSEANEERLERRTQLSDTQSVGNFSTSDDGNNSFKRDQSSFSYSDSPSSLVENAPVDSDQGAKVLHSTEAYGSEIVNESLGVMSHGLVLSPDTCIGGKDSHTHGEASGSGLVTELHSDHAARSPADSLVGPEIGGNGTNLVDSIDVAPRDSSHTNEDFTKVSESTPVDESEAEDPNVVAEACQIRDEIQVLDKSSAGDDNDSSSIIQKQICSSLMPGAETSSSNSEQLNSLPASSDHRFHEVDDSVTAIGVYREDSSLTVDTEKSPISEYISQENSLKVPGLRDPHFPDFSDDVRCIEPVSAEAILRNSREVPVSVDSGTGDFVETGPSPSLDHADEDTAVSREDSSSYLRGPSGINHENLDYVVPEVDDEAICSSDTAGEVHRVSNGICLPSDAICSSPEIPMNLQEPLVDTVVPHQNEAEFLDDDNAVCDVKPEKFREVRHWELDFSDSELSTSVSTSYNHSRPKICDDYEEPLPTAKTLNCFSMVDCTETSTYHFNDREDNMSSATSRLPEPEEARKLPADKVGAECPVTDEASPYPEFCSEQSENADHSEVDQPSISSPGLPFTSLATADTLIAYQKDASLESLQEDLPSHTSIPEFSFKPAAREVDTLNQASNPFESPIPSVVLLPEAPQVVLAELPPLPPLPPMQWRMGFGSGLGMGMGMGEGSQGLFPPIQQSRPDEEVEIKLPASHSISQQPENPFSPPAIKQDETFVQVAEPTMVNDADSQYNLFLSSLETSSERHGRSHPSVDGETVQSASSSLSLPQKAHHSTTQNHAETAEVMVFPPDDINGQHNPFLSSLGTSIERHGQVDLAAVEETLQSASVSFSPALTTQPTSTQRDDVSHAASQASNPAPEAGYDGMTQKQSLPFPEEKEGPSVASMPPPPAADEQVRLGFLMPEGEARWLSNNTSMISNAEENGNPVPKIPRPRNPLIDAVNAHGTSKLRKVADRIRPELGPKTDQRDSLLEQIRTKSFSLKPTTATRPSMAAFNKTNLKVAAILAKANAIRQSCAGSDDEDEDNWE